MKKIFLLLAVAIVAIAASCENNSAGNKESNDMNHNEQEMHRDSMHMNQDSTMHNN